MTRTTIAAALLAACAGASAHGQKAPAALTSAADGLPGIYDDADIFAQIVRHQAPAARAYEDADTLAFMSLDPDAPGHVPVAVPSEAPARMMAAARRVMIAQRGALGARGALILASNGGIPAVPHFHLHVIPTRPGDRVATRLTTEGKPPRAALQAVAAKSAAAMPPA